MQRQFTRFLSTPTTTALGGLLFLLPIVVVSVLLAYVYRTVAVIHEVVKAWIPFESAIGLALLFGLVIVVLLAMCFVAGLLAQRAIGRRFTRTIEQQLIQIYPKYAIYRDLLAGKLGGGENAPSLQPVLVRKDGVLTIAFEVDRLANHLVVVFFPAHRTPGMDP